MKLSPVIISSLTSIILLSGCGGGSSDSSSSPEPVVPSEPTTPTNNAPIANAGASTSVVLGETITLSGADSSDSDGDALTYLWSITSSPTGSAASLSGEGQVSATFTPDVAGEYVFSLVVNDGTEDSAPATVTITVTEETQTNQVPIANAGANTSVVLGETVTLSGADSSDSDGDTLTYLWSIASAPSGSAAELTDEDQISVTFTPDIAGEYVFSLFVNDGTDDSAAATVTITVTEETQTNQAPIANAGTDQTVDVEQSITISGANSSDPNGDAITYQWTLGDLPKGSQLALTEAQQSAQSITFVPDASGDYVITLSVNDGQLASTPVSVTVTAESNNLDITDKIFVEQSGSCIEYLGTFQSSVEDIKRGLSFSGSVTISANASECVVQINQIPNHDFNDQSARFANDVAEVQSSYNIPITPKQATSPTSLVIGTTEAVMLNGVTLDILPAACYGVGDEPLGEEKIGCGPDQNANPWRYDPMSPLNTFGTDQHNAHTQPTGKYHYHANPVAMFTQACEEGIASPVIGFAADGYPIFGSCFIDSSTGETRKAQSSYQLKNNGGERQDVEGYLTPQAGVGDIASSNYDGQFRGDWEFVEGAGDLDQCNGMTVDGQYGYFVTDSFPWIINCFKGELDSSFSRAGELERRSHSHEELHASGTAHSH